MLWVLAGSEIKAIRGLIPFLSRKCFGFGGL